MERAPERGAGGGGGSVEGRRLTPPPVADDDCVEGKTVCERSPPRRLHRRGHQRDTTLPSDDVEGAVPEVAKHPPRADHAEGDRGRAGEPPCTASEPRTVSPVVRSQLDDGALGVA